jgi:hypothetical protein
VPVPVTSSFTAINRSQTHLPTPYSSTPVQVQRSQTRPRVAITKRRKRNPTVAQYLGLGSSNEPSHLEKYAPLPDGPRSPPCKRPRTRRRLHEATHLASRPESEAAVSIQTPVTDDLYQNTSIPDVVLSPSLPSTACEQSLSARNLHNAYFSDEENFDDDLSDEEFLKLMSDAVEVEGNIGGSTSFPANTTANSDTFASSAIHGLKKFVSPMTSTSRLLAATNDIDCAVARKPIIRPSFPLAVRDRSPIIGLSSNMLLRTCFRIGEAINQAHQSSKSGKPIMFELYARIFDSTREDTKQHFTFCDLFHAKPPYIKAVYEGAIWKAVELFDYDSRRLLQHGRICRCMGTMKRDGKEWVMVVANIWEATWDDIKWVEGIVNA